MEKTRREELIEIIGGENIDKRLVRIVEEALFLEEKLEELKKYDFIKVDENDSKKQRVLPAAKLYKDFLQQYVNVVKVITTVTNNEDAEDSPLREYFKSQEMKPKYG